MPLWVLVYISGYVTFSLWAHLSDYRGKKINNWAIFEIVGNVCLLAPALVYWYPALYSFTGEVIVVPFIFGLISVAVFAIRGSQRNFHDPELSLSQRIGFSLLSTALLFAITAPLIWWGSEVIWKH